MATYTNNPIDQPSNVLSGPGLQVWLNCTERDGVKTRVTGGHDREAGHFFERLNRRTGNWEIYRVIPPIEKTGLRRAPGETAA